MPYPAADRLYAITAWNASRGAGAATVFCRACRRPGVDRRHPDDLLTAFQFGGIETIGENETARSAEVDSTFFDVLGVKPLAGGFHPSHFVAPTPIRPAVLTYEFWQSRFAGERAPSPAADAGDRGQGIEVVGIFLRFPRLPALTRSPASITAWASAPLDQQRLKDGRWLHSFD